MDKNRQDTMHRECIGYFFDAFGEWVDTYYEIDDDTFSYQGHGEFVQLARTITCMAPVIKLGALTNPEIWKEQEPLSEYLLRAWKFFGLEELDIEFQDDGEMLLQKIDALIDPDALALLFSLKEKNRRMKALALANYRASGSLITIELIATCLGGAHV